MAKKFTITEAAKHLGISLVAVHLSRSIRGAHLLLYVKTAWALTRFWMRLSDRSRMPRCWWYPVLSTEVRYRTIVLDTHQKCSETITKAMLTLLGIALFCLLTALGSPDKLLLAADSTIKVPFADAPISFLGFMIVAPLLLIVVTVYLHIFYGYWLELERERRQINQSLIGTAEQQIEGVPSLFYLTDFVPRLLTSLIFYWLVPLVFLTITWKALARPEIGRPLIYITGLVTFILVFLQLRRRAENRPRWWSALSGAILIFIIILMLFSILNPASFHRPLDIFRVELPKAWLVSMQMSGAEGSYANLQEANLQGANLKGANLKGANLKGANLDGANLKGANLQKATLEMASLDKANLERANLSGTNLNGANFLFAKLQGANLSVADLRGANLDLADLQGADLDGANLKGAALGGTNLTQARLVNANLHEAELEQANLEGANLDNAKLEDAYLGHTNLRNAKLTVAQLALADNWKEAFYDAKMITQLGLEADHNDKVVKTTITILEGPPDALPPVRIERHPPSPRRRKID